MLKKIQNIIASILSFLVFYLFYGFAIFYLVNQLLLDDEMMNVEESRRYSLVTALVVAPIVYLCVQLAERKVEKTKRLQENLRLEIRNFIDKRKSPQIPQI